METFKKVQMQQENQNENFIPLSARQVFLTQEIMNITYKIHKTLGPGLLESVYEKCFAYELDARNISYKKQYLIDIIYNDLIVEDALKIDLWIEDLIIIELKAQENENAVWQAQLLSYLKLTGMRLGYLLNFHVPLMKSGIKRMIL